MNESKYHNSTAIGIRRLIAEPYDDKTVFTNPIDLLIYSQAGTRYNGQQASLIYYNKQIDVIINNNQPILKFPNIDYYKKYDGIYYVLLYYHNTFPNKGTTSFPNHSIYIDDPDRFTIIGLMDLFRGDELEQDIKIEVGNNLDHIIKYKEPNNGPSFYENINRDFMFIRTNSSGEKHITTFTQTVYPLTNFLRVPDNNYTIPQYKTQFIKKRHNPELSDPSNYYYYDCQIYEDNGNYTDTFKLFPSGTKNDSPFITELYMEANSYVKAMLGET